MKILGYDLSLKRSAGEPVKPGSSRQRSALAVRLINGQVQLYSKTSDKLISESFLKNSDLYAVVMYLLRKTKRAKFYLYEVKDKKALDDYMLLKGEGATVESIAKASALKTKALVATSNTQIEKLLTTPNADQGWGEFLEHAIAYKLLTGERMIHKLSGAWPVSQMYILPPTLVRVEGGDRFMQIKEFVYTPTQQVIPVTDIKFSKTFYPALGGTGNELRGLSPLQVMALSIQKSNEGYLAGVKQFANAGPPVILTFPDADMTPEQAEEYEYHLQEKQYGQNRQLHVANMKADWTQIGLSPVDLELMKSLEFDLRTFCRGYGLDSKVLGDPTSSTYNNMAEARKAAIVDAVVPEVEAMAEDLRAVIEPFNTGSKQYFIDGDVSAFPELAEDINRIIERNSKMWYLTPNQMLEAAQYEKQKNPLFDEPWVPSGLTPLSEYAAMSDVNPNQQPKNDGSY